MKQNPLEDLMNPRSIATVGAGNNPMKMGTMHALSIINSGFQGRFFPVHPRDEKVLGHRAYPSVPDLPETPDLAVIIIPTEQVKDVIEEFGKLGTRRAIIITAGFKEVGSEGVSMERELNETAEKYGIRFVGPNCIGIINTGISLNTTVVSIDNSPDSLGLLSQSGTYVAQTQPYLLSRGIRYSKAISLGNEANIDIVDALEYLGEDDQTRAIALYIEGIRDGRRFIDVARRVTRKKPVIAQYVGGTVSGARSGLSHTGAMAGPDFLYDGVFEQAGIVKVHSVEELYTHGWALAKQPRLKGNRLGIITNSGGPGTAIADTADRGGMEIPPFSEKLRNELKEHIPGHSPSGNPVDLTFHMDMQILTETLPEIIMKSGEVDGLVLHGAMSTGFMRAVYPNIKSLINNMPLEDFLKSFERDLSGATKLPEKYDIPLLVSSFFDRNDGYTVAFQDNGIPVFDSPEKAARAMLTMDQYRKVLERKLEEPVDPAKPSNKAAGIIGEAKDRGQKSLDEHQAKQVLAAYGIPTVDESLCLKADEAVAAAEGFGFPVVLKACSPDILHKTGMGLIRLSIMTADETASAFMKIREAAGRDVPVLVQRMAKGSREVLAGMIRFPAFGPAVLFGMGGIYTEIFKDNTIRIAPVSRENALEMARGIRSSEMLGEFRGMPGVDPGSIADILVSLGSLALNHREIREIDVNPIIINDSSPVAVDALMVLED